MKPSYEALKKEGIIIDYKVWTNVTTDGPQDWDVALGLLFPKWFFSTADLGGSGFLL